MSGSLFGRPKTFPKILSFLINLSFFVIDGSSYNPTPINPPGAAYNKSFFSVRKFKIRLLKGVHTILFTVFNI